MHALDISSKRLEALSWSARAAGLGGVMSTEAADLREYSARLLQSLGAGAGAEPGQGALDGRVPQLYDKVLLDAPCSGVCVM